MDRMNKPNLLNNKIPYQPSKGKKSDTKLYNEHSADKLKEELQRTVVFSWKYFDKDHEVYNCGGIQMPWIISLLETLKSISGLLLEELTATKNKKGGLRFHKIRWGKVQEKKFNFNDVFFEQIKDESYQLSLSTAKGRFHGFLVHNIFFIVWLDPYHQLELMKDHGGVRKFDFPKNENEILCDEIETLHGKINFLEEELETASILLDEAAK
ncbi:hypothetical protein ABEX00_12750 [Bacillus safensis]